MNLVRPSIMTELTASGQLPTPTGVAMTILDLARDPDTSTEDMAGVLHADPALTGQILKYANSATSGSRAEILSINDALVRLGMSMIRQLCLGFSLLSSSKRGPCPNFDYQRYWSRSLAMAVSCQALCEQTKAINPDEGFTCGLLGNIGQLALASVYPSRYSEILELGIGHDPALMIEKEQEFLSIDHNQVSASLFEDWGLPSYYSAAAIEFETISASTPLNKDAKLERHEKLARMLSVASMAADICLDFSPQNYPLVMNFLSRGTELGYTEAEWTEIFGEILIEWNRMGAVLEIPVSNTPSLEDLLSRAREYTGPIEDRRKTGPVLAVPAKPVAAAPPVSKKEAVDKLIQESQPDESHGLKILVATDCPIVMWVLERKLIEGNHHIIKAKDGREALQLALQENPELILTDWRMPEMSGIELCQTLRQSDAGERTHIIIMTAQEDADHLVEAFDAGVDDYLAKPLNHRFLAARLQAAERIIRLQAQTDKDREAIRATVAELGIANRMLQRMAMEDQLTLLPNRRAGLEHLEEQWLATAANKKPLLCMLLDIDHFKKVNDTYGHDAGDVVLKDTAQVMRTALRSSDVICRFGGEEFLVICPGADLDIAKRLGDRIRKSVQDNNINCAEFKGSITISVGIAIRSAKHASAKDLIKESDDALYAAKEAGRNLVCIANPD